MPNKRNPVEFFLRNLITAVWIGVGIFFYAIAIYIVRIFSKNAAHTVSIWWCQHLAFFAGIKTKVHGMEKLDMKQHYIFLANHSSLLDIIALYCAIPFRMSFIARKNLFSIPLWGWALYLAGHIPIDREDPKKAKTSFEKAIRRINEQKRSIFAFPEGSRSRSNEMGEFKLGIFSLALKAGVDIVPVAISGARELMPRDALFINPGSIYVDILDPIPVAGLTGTEKFALAQKTKEAIYNSLHIEAEKPQPN